jgi:hypothetical protein
MILEIAAVLFLIHGLSMLLRLLARQHGRIVLAFKINPTCAESIVAINAINDLDEKSSLHFS